MQKKEFTIKGIHCKSCKTLIETEVDALNGIKQINVNHTNGSCSIEFDNSKIKLEDIFKIIKKLNYQPENNTIPQSTLNVQNNKKNNLNFLYGIAIPLLLALIIGGYYYSTKSGNLELFSKLNNGEASLSIIFLIGLMTSFHCVGMCGGLIISYSANNIKNKQNNINDHFKYNFGRFLSYTIIGGILGGIGSFFGINPNFSGSMLLMAGILMFSMGLSFLTNYPIFKIIKLKTPQFIAKYLYSQKHSQKPKAPLIIGLLNGFMPCGPLQAMELYALSTGNAYQGALVMAVYSLGTIPMMFGFGTIISKLSQNIIHKIIKFSGVLIIILGLIMFNRGLINFGLGINFKSVQESNTKTEKNLNQPNFQEIKMNLGYYGYEPNTLYIKQGIPVRWVINVTTMSGCTNAIMIESLGIEKNLIKGKNIIEFMPPKNVNEIEFSCWMRMVWGKFIIIN